MKGPGQKSDRVGHEKMGLIGWVMRSGDSRYGQPFGDILLEYKSEEKWGASCRGQRVERLG